MIISVNNKKKAQSWLINEKKWKQIYDFLGVMKTMEDEELQELQEYDR